MRTKLFQTRTKQGETKNNGRLGKDNEKETGQGWMKQKDRKKTEKDKTGQVLNGQDMVGQAGMSIQKKIALKDNKQTKQPDEDRKRLHEVTWT